MNEEEEKIDKSVLLFTPINNYVIKSVNELDVLGLYTYLRYLIENETTTVTIIIDRIIEKFKVDYEFVMFVLKQFEKEGLFTIVKKKD